MTAEERTRAREQGRIITKLRAGEKPTIPLTFTRRQVGSMERAARTDRFVSGFKRLEVSQAEEVWNKANDHERADVRSAYLIKLKNALANARDPDDKQHLATLNREVYAWRPGAE